MKKAINIKDYNTLEEIINLVELGELFVSFNKDVVDDEGLYCENGRFYEVIGIPCDNEGECLTEIEGINVQFLLYGDDASYVLIED